MRTSEEKMLAVEAWRTSGLSQNEYCKTLGSNVPLLPTGYRATNEKKLFSISLELPSLQLLFRQL